MENKTKSTKYFLVAAALSALCFIIAAILYLIPFSGKVEFIDYNVALKKSSVTNKPIYVSFYARWNVLSKKISKTLYSNDSLADFLNKNTEPVIFRVDDSGGEDSAQANFGLDNFMMPILLDKYGRFLSQVLVSDVNSAVNHMKILLKNPFLYINDMDDVIKSAKENGKPAVVMVMVNPELANSSFTILVDNIMKEDSSKYNFSSLLLYSPHDEKYLEEISKRFQNINLHPQPLNNGLFIQRKNPEISFPVLIFDGNRNLIGNFAIDDILNSKFSLQDSIAKYSGIFK